MHYLVTCRIKTSLYMDDSETKRNKILLVRANSEDDAAQKVVAHYNALTDAYSIYYDVDIIDVDVELV